MNVWITMIIAGVLTYVQRLSFIIIFERTEVPESVRRALRLVPPAVLTAIITPELFLHSGSLDLSLGNHRLIAGKICDQLKIQQSEEHGLGHAVSSRIIIEIFRVLRFDSCNLLALPPPS